MQFDDDDLLLYPTDTIYGLGVDATSPEMVQKLKYLKGREEGKAISIAVSDIEMLKRYAEVTPLAEKLIEVFLPGKLTLILNARDSGLRHLSQNGTIGVRIPALEKILELIQEFGKPITATSANVSGMPTEDTPENILAQFGEKAKMITRVIDVGILPLSEPSTVVDARGNKPILIREGAILEKDIMRVCNT